MTDLQSANRVKIGRVREATFGVTPASPAFEAMRIVSDGLALGVDTKTSNEIRSDRQVTDVILLGTNAQGPVGGELSFGAFDKILEEGLQGTWQNNATILVATTDTEISDVGTAVITVASGGGAFTAGTVTLMTGFTTAGNNKKARVTSSTGTSITYPAATFTAEGAAIPVGAQIRAVGFQGAAADITATASGLASTLLDFTTFGLVVGEWLKVGGSAAGDQFATAVLNDWVRISAVAAHALTFDILPTGWTTDAGTGKTVAVWMGDYLRNGTTKLSASLERQYLDHSPVSYEYLVGMTIDTFSIDMSAQDIITIAHSYIGAGGSIGSTRKSGATDVAAPTNPVLNTSSNMQRLALDGVPVTGPNFVMSAKFDIKNNLRAQKAVANVAPVGVGNGEFTFTGELNCYFGDPSIRSKIIAGTPTSLDARYAESSGNKQTILFDMPRMKYLGGSQSETGKNTDVMLPAQFQVFMHPTLGYTTQIERYWYVES